MDPENSEKGVNFFLTRTQPLPPHTNILNIIIVAVKSVWNNNNPDKSRGVMQVKIILHVVHSRSDSFKARLHETQTAYFLGV